MLNNKKLALFLMLILLLVISGCKRLDYLDNKAEELLNIFNSEDSIIEDIKKDIDEKDDEEEEKNPKINSKDLSKELRDDIDKWLENNELNRYGDKIGTMYTGGTPLFDEKTGESIERFQYIFEKIPDVLDKL